MQCPYCQNPVHPGTPECPACRLTFPRTSALVGALPRLAQVLSDSSHYLTPAEQTKLKKKILAMQLRFPELVLQVVLHTFPSEHPFSMHAFWMFNAAKFAGDSRRGKDNHSLLIVVDPVRAEAAIVPGYGLEPLLQKEAIMHLLELAGPAWDSRRWGDGLLQILLGLDQLLESVAKDMEKESIRGEF